MSTFNDLPEELKPTVARLCNHTYELGRSSAFEDQRVMHVVTDDYQRGYSAAVADMAALQRQQVAIAREAAQAGPYSALCDLRGDHERAQRARQHEQRIAAMPSPTEVGRWAA